MKSLYQWLIEDKGYTEAEAEETVIIADILEDIPKEVIKIINEYTRLFIKTFH